MLMLLPENQSQPTLTLRILPSKQLALREFPNNIYWLAKEYEEHRIIRNHPNTAQSPTSRLWYLSNDHNVLQAHMHPLHKLGNAKSVSNYHEHYQAFIKNGTANGAASNAYLTAPYVPLKPSASL